ncbi:hypothetical protein Tco_0623463 [Tanacetum coccineum]
MIVMSDLEDSTVTYTEVSSSFEDLSDIGSLGVDGLPMMPEDPYAYVRAALQAPPSPDYVPGPEHPPSPIYVPYVPEPAYLEFMPPEDDVLPAEEQLLPAAISPTADSLGYITESDPEEDPDEDDEHLVGYGITDTWDEMVDAMQEVPATDVAELSQRMTDFVMTVRQDNDEIYGRLYDKEDDRSLMSGQLNLLRRDRRAHARTARLMESEDRLSSEAWVQSMDASDMARFEVRALRTTVLAQQTEIEDLRAADRRRHTHLTEVVVLRSGYVVAMLYSLLRVADVLAEREATRSRNGEDIHDSGIGGRRQAPLARECTYPDFMKCKPLYFKGTEGVVELTQWFERMEIVFRISNCTMENKIKFATCTLLGSALTWWNSHVRTFGHDVAYAMLMQYYVLSDWRRRHEF